MRIAIVHSMYRSDQPSGENNTVIAQADQLRKAGNEVLLVQANSDDIDSKILAAARISVGAGLDPTAKLKDFGPDVVHVHNMFPNFSDRWLRRLNVPVVTTLHNFRYTCASGTLFRSESPCSLCIDHSHLNSLIHGCYRDSRLATLPMYITVSRGPDRSKLLATSSKIVALSTRAYEIHIKAGIKKDKLVLVPNFVAPFDGEATASSRRWAYVGRLSPEKGIEQLLRVWPADIPLDIYGDGPLRGNLERTAPVSVRFHGVIPGQEVQGALVNARGLVFPSIWPESAYPMSYLDGLSASLPVIALSGNAAADDIKNHNTGAVFEGWRNVQDAITRVDAKWEYYSANSIARYRTAFSPDQWVTAIHRIYDEVVKSHRNRKDFE